MSHPGTAGQYRLPTPEFAHRHKTLAGTVAAIFAVLLVGILVSTREAIRANLAKALIMNVLNVRRRVVGPEHNDTLASMNSLALVYQVEGRYAVAERLFAEVWETRKRLLGEDHADTLRSLNNLVEVFRREEKVSDAGHSS